MAEKYIIGIDEVGMGSWAGKVVVCAVRAPISWSMDGLGDSKKLTRLQREKIESKLMNLIKEGIISFYIAHRSNTDIDKLGLGNCHKACCVESINCLYKDGDCVIMDGNLSPNHFYKFGLRKDCNIRTEIKADSKFSSVMAASIIAKQYRDKEMYLLHEKFPKYNWKSNVGYISKAHKMAVKEFGLTDLHRKSYKVNLFTAPTTISDIKIKRK